MGTVGDFVGVQNYSRLRFGPDGMLLRTENVTGAGLELVPTSLAATCRQTHELTRLPVLITEHGADLDDSQDDRRAAFIEESLRELASAIADGVDVRGYLHWSLMDNYEWSKGYEGHFGLLGVDRATQASGPVLGPERSYRRAGADRQRLLVLLGDSRDRLPRAAHPYGNAERFIRTLLAGWAYGAVYRNSTERAAALDGWLWYYNHQQRHSALGHKPPIARLTERTNLRRK